MLIVKMNSTTVECNIAASELREIGLTPEDVVNGLEVSVPFLSQINKEVGERLDYNPQTEVMMMSRNMMNDGSVRIFAVKMNNDDIQKAADRLRSAASAVLSEITQDRVDDIKNKTGKEKGLALNAMMSEVSETINKVYAETISDSSIDKPQASTRKLTDHEKYLIEFEKFDNAKRFSKVASKLPIEESSLYKYKDKYYIVAELHSFQENILYEIRRDALEYAELMTVNNPDAVHIEENGDKILAADAIMHLAKLM
ncbi:MAG: adaptor protein MecA [Butyrivibrio sp.]|nr:adaptor protein MecA [Butyrivibrio sp.]